jgi:uncharacterized membrane protein YdjX (TVP38/TMEM64 family)
MTEPAKRNGTRALVLAGVKAAILLAFLALTTWGAVCLLQKSGFSLPQLAHINAETLKREFGQAIQPMEDWKDSHGVLARLAFVGIQVGQIVVFVVPGEATQVLGGYLFGTWEGALYCVIGAAIGSGLAFLLADWLGRPLIKFFIRPEQFARLENMLNRRKGWVSVFVLFLFPGVPKDMLCYIAGLTPMHFGAFVLLSTLARIPGILLCTFGGDSIAEKHYHMFLALCILGLVVLVLGLFFRRRVESWISHNREQGE